MSWKKAQKRKSQLSLQERREDTGRVVVKLDDENDDYRPRAFSRSVPPALERRRSYVVYELHSEGGSRASSVNGFVPMRSSPLARVWDLEEEEEQQQGGKGGEGGGMKSEVHLRAPALQEVDYSEARTGGKKRWSASVVSLGGMLKGAKGKVDGESASEGVRGGKGKEWRKSLGNCEFLLCNFVWLGLTERVFCRCACSSGALRMVVG